MKNSDSITLREAGKTAFFARDFKTAFERFGEAAALGDAEAQCFLGEFYDDFGRGFPVDFAKARGLYEKSLAQGFARAGTNLSALFSNGQGVPRDEAEADNVAWGDSRVLCSECNHSCCRVAGTWTWIEVGRNSSRHALGVRFCRTGRLGDFVCFDGCSCRDSRDARDYSGDDNACVYA